MCPLYCSGLFLLEKDLWHHLEDVYNTLKLQTGTKRKACSDESLEKQPWSSRTVKRKCGPELLDELNRPAVAKFIYISAVDLDKTQVGPDVILLEGTNSSGRSTPMSLLFDVSMRFPSPMSASPLPVDLDEMIIGEFLDSSGSSIPSPSMFDMVFSSMVMLDLLLPPPDDFIFGVCGEQLGCYTASTEDVLSVGNSPGSVLEERMDGILPGPSTVAELAMDMVDPVLRVDTSVLEPMDGITARPLRHYEVTLLPVVVFAAAESEGVIAKPLPNSLGSTLEDDQGKAIRCNSKITRIVIKDLAVA